MQASNVDVATDDDDSHCRRRVIFNTSALSSPLYTAVSVTTLILLIDTIHTPPPQKNLH